MTQWWIYSVLFNLNGFLFVTAEQRLVDTNLKYPDLLYVKGRKLPCPTKDTAPHKCRDPYICPFVGGLLGISKGGKGTQS